MKSPRHCIIFEHESLSVTGRGEVDDPMYAREVSNKEVNHCKKVNFTGFVDENLGHVVDGFQDSTVSSQESEMTELITRVT